MTTRPAREGAEENIKEELRERVTIRDYLRWAGREIICPSCRGTLDFEEGERHARCLSCGLRFDVYAAARHAKRQRFDEALREVAQVAGMEPEAAVVAYRRQRGGRRGQGGPDARWRRLAEDHEAGRAWLLERLGCDVEHAELRFTADGDPALPVRDLTGSVVGFGVRRREPGPAAKHGLVGNPRGLVVTFGDAERYRQTAGPIVLARGLVDHLAASWLWPDRLVLSLFTKATMAAVAGELAQLIGNRGILFVPAGNDGPCRRQAIVELLKAGVGPWRIELLELPHESEGLAEAMASGSTPRVRSGAESLG